ncbi:MAG TPA: hypothetical protein EYN14_13380 [Alphaproteobacteria bacterium]|nr:hypothetical protein [Alphaproteobacteria bacterium]
MAPPRKLSLLGDPVELRGGSDEEAPTRHARCRHAQFIELIDVQKLILATSPVDEAIAIFAQAEHLVVVGPGR